MNKISKTLMIIACIFSVKGLASSSLTSRQCDLLSNPNKTALVAGRSFQLAVGKDFGVNNVFATTATLTSPFLGFCQGLVQENKNPSAEGPIGAAEITGERCAADGFTLFLGAGCGADDVCVVQVDEAPEDTYYLCK